MYIPNIHIRIYIYYNMGSVELNRTFTHTIDPYSFGNLSTEEGVRLFKDGRVFSHFIEVWIAKNYPLKHILGCKSYDFIDSNDPTILYDEKTFTINGCNYVPSNMLGQGRTFNRELFEEKSKKLIFCIVSNINFPEIKIKFIRGADLLSEYPNGKIPLNDHVKFFH